MERNMENRRPVPVHPTCEEYHAERRLIRHTYAAMLVFTVILLVPLFLAALLLWTADFFSSCTACVIALLIIGIPTLILLTAVAQTLFEEHRRLQLLTRNYHNAEKPQENASL